MNSVLQCLSCTIPLTRIFLDGTYKKYLNKSNPLGTGGQLAMSYANLIYQMWNTQTRAISPIDFKQAISRFAPQFSGNQQHDAQEFLGFLLDGLHEDLNNKTPNYKPTNDPEDPNIPIHILGQMSWENYLKRNNSHIVNIFQGQLKSTLTCLDCGKQSITFNPFMYLSVPIRPGDNLMNCLKHYTEEEFLEESDCWNCPRCKRYRRAKKQLTIWKLPDILLIHYKRFFFSGPWRDKLDHEITFPFRGLEMSGFVPNQRFVNPSAQNNSTSYNLFAFVNHFGGLNGGHYTAICKNPYRKAWYKFDDNYVTELKESEIQVKPAYILFYVRNQ